MDEQMRENILQRVKDQSHRDVGPHFVCVRVAPYLPVDPGSGHHAVVLVLQPLGPVPAADGRQQPSGRVADVHLGVLAAGRPDHGPAQRVVLDVEGELPVVVVDLAHPGALVEVDGQQVPVVCLEEHHQNIS